MKKTILTLLLCLGGILQLAAQDKLKIALKSDPKPDIYIDGKKYDPAIVDLLDNEKIKSVKVIKGDEAKEEYNAPNGVILITSINSKEKSDLDTEIKNKLLKTDPIVIIDGIKSSQDDLKKLDPSNIESIEVIKGEKAIKEYGAEGGVIKVKTKD